MKISRSFLLALLVLFSIYARGQNKKIDVYLIAGQSNATRQGYLKNMTSEMTIDTTVMIFNSGLPHLNSGKQPFTWLPLRQASESPDRFGPELGFGKRIHQLFPKNNIAIIKHAHSGTNLYKQWNPGLNEKDTLAWGQQFKVFVETVNLGMEGLIKMGYKPTIRGILWQQGENDAKDTVSGQYAKNLTHFIERVRKQFKTGAVPFVYGYVLPPPNEGYNRDVVRQAEHDIDEHSGSDLAVKHAIVVQTDDLSQRANDKNTRYPKDYVHFGTNGTWQLGFRMADAFK